MALEQLEGLNMKSGRKADGKRPVVERSEQVWCNLMGVQAKSHGVSFPLKEAYDRAKSKIQSVDLGESPAGSGATGGGRSAGSHAAGDVDCPPPDPPSGDDGDATGAEGQSDEDATDDEGPAGPPPPGEPVGAKMRPDIDARAGPSTDWSAGFGGQVGDDGAHSG